MPRLKSTLTLPLCSLILLADICAAKSGEPNEAANSQIGAKAGRRRQFEHSVKWPNKEFKVYLEPANFKHNDDDTLLVEQLLADIESKTCIKVALVKDLAELTHSDTSKFLEFEFDSPLGGPAAASAARGGHGEDGEDGEDNDGVDKTNFVHISLQQGSAKAQKQPRPFIGLSSLGCLGRGRQSLVMPRTPLIGQRATLKFHTLRSLGVDLLAEAMLERRQLEAEAAAKTTATQDAKGSVRLSRAEATKLNELYECGQAVAAKNKLGARHLAAANESVAGYSLAADFQRQAKLDECQDSLAAAEQYCDELLLPDGQLNAAQGQAGKQTGNKATTASKQSQKELKLKLDTQTASDPNFVLANQIKLTQLKSKKQPTQTQLQLQHNSPLLATRTSGQSQQQDKSLKLGQQQPANLAEPKSEVLISFESSGQTSPAGIVQTQLLKLCSCTCQAMVPATPTYNGGTQTQPPTSTSAATVAPPWPWPSPEPTSSEFPVPPTSPLPQPTDWPPTLPPTLPPPTSMPPTLPSTFPPFTSTFTASTQKPPPLPPGPTTTDFEFSSKPTFVPSPQPPTSSGEQTPTQTTDDDDDGDFTLPTLSPKPTATPAPLPTSSGETTNDEDNGSTRRPTTPAAPLGWACDKVEWVKPSRSLYKSGRIVWDVDRGNKNYFICANQVNGELVPGKTAGWSCRVGNEGKAYELHNFTVLTKPESVSLAWIDKDSDSFGKSNFVVLGGKSKLGDPLAVARCVVRDEANELLTLIGYVNNKGVGWFPFDDIQIECHKYDILACGT